MKLMLGIPVVCNGVVLRENLNSIAASPATIVVLDNGSEPDVKEVLNDVAGYSNFYIIVEEQNIFVQPAWNKLMAFFLESDCTHIVLMNSDVIMNRSWYTVLKSWLDVAPQEIPVPEVNIDKQSVNNWLSYNRGGLSKEVTSGTAGVFICLSREHVGHIFPLPESIKVWFGDQYAFTVLRELGYKTIVSPSLQLFHGGSETVKRVPGIFEIIEQDKVMWEKEVEPAMWEKIKQLKANSNI